MAVVAGLLFLILLPWSRVGSAEIGKKASNVGFPAESNRQPNDNLFRRGDDSGCKCGVSPKVKEYIVGGKVAEKDKYIWMAHLALSIGPKNYLFCGGSIITDRHILTAAHCFLSGNVTILSFVINGVANISVAIGSYDVYDSPGEFIMATKIECHPNFNDQEFPDDICLVTLGRPIQFTNSIRPLCLPAKEIDDSKLYGTVAEVTGWGVTAEGARNGSRVLKVANVTVYDLTTCRDYMGQVTLFDAMLCAGVLAGGTDACQGDSGGPLQQKIQGRYYQIGIVSVGIGCAEANRLGIYTRVDKYMDWINARIGGGRKCH